VHDVVTTEQIYCLTEMLRDPQFSTQRCVEHLGFLETGGHQWTRHIQVRIPATSPETEMQWRVVSLGAYARRRFPDFRVENAAGEQLSLVTREQHGHALTQSTINKLLAALPETAGVALEKALPHSLAYRRFWIALYAFFTTSGELSADERAATTSELTTLCSDFLAECSLSEEECLAHRDGFMNEVVELLDITRYLCWMQASPGDVLDVRVTYTTLDPRRRLGRGTFAERLAVLWEGLAEPRVTRWKVWADWYRQFGLAPLNYEFSVPGSVHAGSYYFTVEPPPGTSVTYLDWGEDNSLESTEIDCSARSAHIHNRSNATRGESSRGGTIRAYLHCTPRDHKLLVGTALLNCALAFLVAGGRIHGKTGSPAQSLLLAVPSIYIAYLARQQQHYFADAMRRQRGILWWYLAFCVAFLLTLAFGNHDGAQGSRGFSPLASVVVWTWATSSAVIAAWYFPLGGSYERVTESLTRRKIARVRATQRDGCSVPAPSWPRRVARALPITRALIHRRLWRKYEVLRPGSATKGKCDATARGSFV
jgi:hypothetical protein